MEFLFPSFTPPLGGARASSHNWSTSSETRNDENTLIIHDKIVTDQYFQAFAYLYNFAGGVLNATEFAQVNHQLIVYPNPTADIAYIKSDSRTANQSGSYTIFNVAGNKILEKHFTQLKDTPIDLTTYPKGLYFINLKIGDKTYQKNSSKNKTEIYLPRDRFFYELSTFNTKYTFSVFYLIYFN